LANKALVAKGAETEKEKGKKRKLRNFIYNKENKKLTPKF